MINKLNNPVRLPTGEITTLARLLDEKRACVSKCDNFGSRRTESGVVTKYFVDLLPPLSGCWEISEYAYHSRKGDD